MKAVWRTMLEGAIDEAVLAVDLYNQPRQSRRLEGFLVHMHLAWLYLLHAEFKKSGVDYRYRLPNGRFDRIDGEPKTWDLSRCVQERWAASTPVRTNLELTITLRNKVEHRFHEATTLVTTGYAQALLLNFEEELTSFFGDDVSLGEILRFPIFIGSITALGQAQIQHLRDQLPKDTRDFLASFEAELDPSIRNDQRYEFRINLVPKLGAKSAADSSLSFIREDELSDADKKALASLGKSGKVIIREQSRSVASAGLIKPMKAAGQIEARIPYEFKTHHVVRAWQSLKCRPPHGDAHPERTIEKYCVYDEPHKDYLYTEAFVSKVIREVNTEAKFKAFTGLEPVARAG